MEYLMLNRKLNWTITAAIFATSCIGYLMKPSPYWFIAAGVLMQIFGLILIIRGSLIRRAFKQKQILELPYEEYIQLKTLIEDYGHEGAIEYLKPKPDNIIRNRDQNLADKHRKLLISLKQKASATTIQPPLNHNR